jgi:HEAT repeat protein
MAAFEPPLKEKHVMKRSLLLGLAVGLCLGVVATVLIFKANRPAEPLTPAGTEVATAKTVAPESVSEAPEPAAEPVTPPPAPAKVASEPTDAASAAPSAFDFKTSFAVLSKKGLAAYGSKEMNQMVDSVKKSGKSGIAQVIEQLQNSTSPQDRFIAAALLEKIGDPSALPALNATLKNESDLMVRRMASHAAAFIGTDAAADVLRPAMAHDEDWGVRVNSAYGLAKLKQQDGLDALQQFYTSPETPAEYRLAILGGLADVAAPSTGPLFRQILADTTDAGYVLIAISALEKMKDTQSLPDLQRVAASAKSETIRQAAQRAIDSLPK